MLLAPALGPLLLALPLVAAPFASASGAGDPLPAPTEGMTIAADGPGGATLLDLLGKFEQVAGVHLLVRADVRAALKALQSGLHSAITIPREEVYSTFETILWQNGFALAIVHADDPLVVRVLAVGDENPTRRALAFAAWVERDQIERWAVHAAILVRTVVDVAPLEAANLAVQVGEMHTDRELVNLTPIVDVHRIIVGGRAAQVAVYVRVLEGFAADARREAAQHDSGARPRGAVPK